ncbi:hypothetical protein G6F56_002209 [Rhizopus delemar]|nr:hypothetical protein G6F56_002209 [Rhizopus delemar]
MNVVSREAQREIISIFNEVLDDFDNLPSNSRISSDDKLKRRLQKLAPNIMKTQEKCPRGCYLYDSFDDVSLVVCPLCKTPRCGKQQKFVSIGQKLAQVLTNEEKRDLLSQGRHEREPVVTQDGKKIYSDIFDV